jgi:AcrR family transcriptional regulator
LETDNRKEQIIKAALKRFSHFGIGKTTMNEIAEDSSISKGNIYYYFADKNTLVTEVVYELLHQFEELVQKRIADC